MVWVSVPAFKWGFHSAVSCTNLEETTPAATSSRLVVFVSQASIRALHVPARTLGRLACAKAAGAGREVERWLVVAHRHLPFGPLLGSFSISIRAL
eukprot:scaffold321872_cov35-Tisochrysis_lutea.AAC.1